MKIEIKNTIKDLTEVVTNFPNVDQNRITLNAGQSIKAQHVQKVGTGLANIHVSDNHVILNVPRQDLEYDRDENEKFFSTKSGNKGQEESRTNPNPNRPRPGCGGCAKKAEENRKQELERRRQQIITKRNNE